MNTRPIFPLVAGLLLAGLAQNSFAAPKPAPDNVTVIYQDPDKFTDVRENQSNTTSTYYLDELRAFLQKTASPRLAAGEKLVITVADIDLAGENLFNQPEQIRIMKDIYPPRVKLRFQLFGADGQVRKEGERKLFDLDFMMQTGRPGGGEPLYYDKQLLRQWVEKEFSPKS